MDAFEDNEAQSPNFNDYNVSTDSQINRSSSKQLHMMELHGQEQSPGQTTIYPTTRMTTEDNTTTIND